ncbi:MAG: hypothetical protein H6719_31455 [Sandaracinaceae bacterium]|nr:hypothetical protein [Sandaracinaceae bacterium]
MRNIFFGLLLVLSGCDAAAPASTIDSGPPPGDPDASLVADAGPPPCPTPELACELDGPPDATSSSPYTMDLADVSPAEGVDSIGLRLEGSIRSSMGTPCATATDAAACMAALEALPAPRWPRGFVNACALPNICPADLVVTRGDEVFVVEDAATMLEVLGTIDTLTEAALIVLATRPPSGPPESGYDVTAVARAGDDFDVIAGYLGAGCFPIIQRSVRLRVEATGTIAASCDHMTYCVADSCI